MTTLTIQLSFEFNLSIDGIYSAIELLEDTIDKGQALAAMQAYNQIFSVLQHCNKNDIFVPTARSNMFCRLVRSQNKLYALYEV